MSEKEIETIKDEEKMRIYFKKILDTYVNSCKKANLPVDKEGLEDIINNTEIQALHIEGTKGTFSVNKSLIRYIPENFNKNGDERNNFLLFHEFTHLISPINEELFNDQDATVDKLKQRAERVQGYFVDEYNAYYGLIAVDEVLAQWTAEELNDVALDKKRQSYRYNEGPLKANMEYTSDFSDNDIYSPLEEPVIKLIKKLGYKDLREFATDFQTNRKTLIDMLNDQDFETICQIGIMCKGIYKDNNFNKSINVTKEEIEKAHELLNKQNAVGENSGGHNESLGGGNPGGGEER